MKGCGAKMKHDKFESLGPLFADVGGELADIVGGDVDGTFLYAEAGEGWLGASVFREDGDVVRYFDPSPALTDLLLQAWETESPESILRWSVMEYEVTGTKFDVQFRYVDEIQVKSFADNGRREAALKRRYGDKPVIYPPIPEHFFTFGTDEPGR
jgi:hypothetical protein